MMIQELYRATPPMDTPPSSCRGFSLVEMAIVLMIIGLLLGGMLMPLSAQLESGKIKQTQALIENVKEALIGYAMINKRLPCAAPLGSTNGQEVAGTADGFVPVNTLGMSGSLDENALLLDAWGGPIRYIVDLDFCGATLAITTPWPQNNNNPDIKICNNNDISDPPACDTDYKGVAANLFAAVILSHGKNGNETTSPPLSLEEVDNLINDPDPGPTMDLYSQDYGQNFDDIMTWISSSTLFYKLVAAGMP